MSGTEALQLFDSFKVDVDGEADSIPMDDYSHQDSEDDDYDDDDTKPIAQLAIVKKKRIKKSLAKHRCNICAKFFQKKHRYEAHMRSHKGLKVRPLDSFPNLWVIKLVSCRAMSVQSAKNNLPNGPRWQNTLEVYMERLSKRK